MASCAKDDSAKEVDATPPTIDVLLPSVTITGEEGIRIGSSELHIGDRLVATWKDNVSVNCSKKVTFDGATVNYGDVITHS